MQPASEEKASAWTDEDRAEWAAQRERDEGDAYAKGHDGKPLKITVPRASEAAMHDLEDLPDDGLHTFKCVAYAARTRRSFCIAECADARRERCSNEPWPRFGDRVSSIDGRPKAGIVVREPVVRVRWDGDPLGQVSEALLEHLRRAAPTGSKDR